MTLWYGHATITAEQNVQWVVCLRETFPAVWVRNETEATSWLNGNVLIGSQSVRSKGGLSHSSEVDILRSTVEVSLWEFFYRLVFFYESSLCEKSDWFSRWVFAAFLGRYFNIRKIRNKIKQIRYIRRISYNYWKNWIEMISREAWIWDHSW